ncbi:ATP-binding cassette sub- A member 12 [Terramyces sp. JEL0728]|nr:ATP-binding cassette sub- A member 12 [Terramyces sp. JEL0728]
MISFYTQTAAIIRLNFTRQLAKGKTKYAIVFFFIYGSLSYILLKALSGTLDSIPEIKDTVDINPLPLYLDTSNLDTTAMAKLQPAINQYNIVTTTRPAYIQSSKNNSLLLSFSKFDSANQHYDYTLYANNDGLSNLWTCISSQFCNFSPDIHAVVETKFLIDSYLGQDKGAGFQVKEAIDIDLKAMLASSTDFFSDVFFFALSSIMVTNMIEERTKGLKFGLFMTGIRRSSYYIGTFFFPILLSTIYAGWNLFMFLDYWKTPSAAGPLFFLLFSSCYAYVGFTWICAQRAPNIRSAILLYTVYILVGVFSSVFKSQLVQNIPDWGIILLCINPRVALAVYTYVSGFSPSGRGFTNTSVPFTAPSVNTLVITSCSYTIALFLIGIYLNWLEVSQDETRPLHYPISQFFKTKKVPEVAEREHLLPKVENSKVSSGDSTNKIQISNLSKLYDGASAKALSDVSLEFAKGEIFGLLGYNGAGKSTLINILCGVLSATDGKIGVFGLDAKEKRFDISERTGICSQVDILFDELSTREHLFFFGLMRGVPANEIKGKISDIVEGLQIPHPMLDMASKSLSGGQKRKLGVALAFINDPELVVLDEMSSGVDPENR